MADRASQALRPTENISSRSALRSEDSAAERFVPVPGVRKIKEAMLKNDAQRQPINWDAADFSRLSARQLTAIQRIVSSLLYSEIHGGAVCGNLLNRVPYADISDAFSVQILDESHHSWLLTRYLLDAMSRSIVKPPVVTWLAVEQLRRLRDPLISTMTASHFVECAAAEVQLELIHKIDEPLLVDIFGAVLRDESRHQALGRESMLFLLETPEYKNSWRRHRARMYRHFLEFYSRITLKRYSEYANLFGIDLPRIHRRTLERVDQAVPL